MPHARCPHCRKLLHVEGAVPGVRLRCPACRGRLRVPAGQTTVDYRPAPPRAEVVSEQGAASAVPGAAPEAGPAGRPSCAGWFLVGLLSALFCLLAGTCLSSAWLLDRVREPAARPQAGGRAPEAPPPAGAEAPAGGAAELARHPYWQKGVDAAAVEKVVETISAQQRGAVVLVGRDGGCQVEVGMDAAETRAVVEYMGGLREQAGRAAGGRVIAVIDTNQWQKRPTRAEVFRTLRRKLDEADYRR